MYWHHFSGNAAAAREIENAFPSVAFGVAPGVLKEQHDDVLEDIIRSTAPERLMVESDAPMVGERRTSNHLWVVSTILDTDSDNGKVCAEDFFLWFGEGVSEYFYAGGVCA